MTTLLLFALLCLISWPLALLVLGIYAVFWLLTLPFRLLGFTLGAVFQLLGFLLKAATWPFRRLAASVA